MRRWARITLVSGLTAIAGTLSVVCVLSAIMWPHIAFLGRMCILLIGAIMARSAWDNGRETLNQ